MSRETLLLYLCWLICSLRMCVWYTREQTIAPTIPLTKSLETLYMFLVHQKATHSTADREYMGTAR